MMLLILLPSKVLSVEYVIQVTVQTDRGRYCLKPNHGEFVSALLPGILVYMDDLDDEYYVAVDSGILVKRQQQVSVATKHAVTGELHELDEVVRDLQKRHEKMKKANPPVAA